MRVRIILAIGTGALLLLASSAKGQTVQDAMLLDDVGPGWSPASCPDTGQPQIGPTVCFAPVDAASSDWLAIGAVPVDRSLDPRVYVETSAGLVGGRPIQTPGLAVAAGRVADFDGVTVVSIVLIAGDHAYTLILSTTGRPPSKAEEFVVEVARRQEERAGRPEAPTQEESPSGHLDRLLVTPAPGSGVEVAQTVDAPLDLSDIGSEARSQEVVELLQDAPARMRILTVGGTPVFFVVLSEQPYDEFAAAGLGAVVDMPLDPLELGVEAVPDAVGFKFPADEGGGMGIAFRKGRYLVLVVTPDLGASEDVAARGLAEVARFQAALLPKGDTAPYFFPPTATSIGFTAGLTTAICGGALGVGRLAAARRRKRTRTKGRVDGDPADAPPGVEDVTRAAAALRRRGTALLVADVVAVNAIVVGALGLTSVLQLPAALTLGLLVVGSLGGVTFTAWWARSEVRRSPRAGFVRELRPSIPGVVGGAVALALLVFGLGFAATGLAGLTFGPSLSGLKRSQVFGVEPVLLGVATLVVGVVLLAIGGFAVRLARMWARVSADRLRARDPRKPVLYLRSFEDDDLRLPAVLSARRPFLELFAARGSDPFEESIAWQVAPYGPVVAIGRPGRSIQSLGAARELLPDEVWQQEVSERMADARAIVVTIGSTDGLRWEVAQLVSGGNLDRTVFVVPPTDNDAIRERWRFTEEALSAAGANLAETPITTERFLAAAIARSGEWWVAVADVRDEATYRVAMDRALGTLTRRETQAAPPGRVG
jgi:hypothetical protein